MNATDRRTRVVAAASPASILLALQSKLGDRSAADISQWLNTLDDGIFETIVRAEVHGRIPAEVADILGNPAICHRWFHVIKAEQTKATQGGQGRYVAQLASRRARATHAIQEAKSHQAGLKTTAGKPKSPRARAIDRLIEAHLDEFNSIVEQEVSAESDA